MYFKMIENFLNKNKLNEISSYIEEIRNECGSGKFSLGQFYRQPETEKEKALIGQILRFFWQSPMPKFYQYTYNEKPMLIMEFCTIRYQEAGSAQELVPWHLDANFYGFDVPLLTFWVPLMDINEDLIGLEFCLPNESISDEFVAGRWSDLVLSQKRNRSISDGEIKNIFGDIFPNRKNIELKMGGCAVFDQFILHRTEINESAKKSRLAIEFRVTSAERYPKTVERENIKNMFVSSLDKNNNIKIDLLKNTI